MMGRIVFILFIKQLFRPLVGPWCLHKQKLSQASAAAFPPYRYPADCAPTLMHTHTHTQLPRQRSMALQVCVLASAFKQPDSLCIRGYFKRMLLTHHCPRLTHRFSLEHLRTRLSMQPGLQLTPTFVPHAHLRK